MSQLSEEPVSLAEAGRRAGRSYSWARDQTIIGSLTTVRLSNGRIGVTAASLARLLEDRRHCPASPSRKTPRRSGLKLVWINPNI